MNRNPVLFLENARSIEIDVHKPTTQYGAERVSVTINTENGSVSFDAIAVSRKSGIAITLNGEDVPDAATSVAAE